MQDLFDGGVEKIAIMADDDHRAAIAPQIILEPHHAFEVEIVGRFVQQQKLRIGKKHSGQCDAHAPAAGKIAGRALLVVMGKAQAGKDRGGAGGCGMGVDIGKPQMDFRDREGEGSLSASASSWLRSESPRAPCR